MIPVHLTPASSMCPQLWLPSGLAGQSMSLDSVPRHWTSSNQIRPIPLVKPEVKEIAAERMEHEILLCLSYQLRPRHTCAWQSQLHTGYSSIYSAPEIIAHCAPDIAVADLHTSLSVGASLKSDGSLSTAGTPHSSIFTVYTVVAP